jgi:hypothetical protein
LWIASKKMLHDEPSISIWKSMNLDIRMNIIIHLIDEQVDYLCDWKRSHATCGNTFEKFIKQSNNKTKVFFSFEPY